MPPPLRTFRDAFRAAGPRPVGEDASARGDKKNYAERLSRNLATVFANLLRKDFAGITPDPSGGKQEAPARTAKGTKKLDVNYSTPELGLGLGVSIKTLNFRDAGTNRYTKNYTRIDNELRAEAVDYHERQPWSVLVAGVFLPVDACDDHKGGESSSSFGQAVKIFRYRAGRTSPAARTELFERVYVGLYALDESDDWDVRFFDVMKDPPRGGRPSEAITLENVIAETTKVYDERNNPPFKWAGE